RRLCSIVRRSHLRAEAALDNSISRIGSEQPGDAGYASLQPCLPTPCPTIPARCQGRLDVLESPGGTRRALGTARSISVARHLDTRARSRGSRRLFAPGNLAAVKEGLSGDCGSNPVFCFTNPKMGHRMQRHRPGFGPRYQRPHKNPQDDTSHLFQGPDGSSWRPPQLRNGGGISLITEQSFNWEVSRLEVPSSQLVAGTPGTYSLTPLPFPVETRASISYS